MTKRKEKPPAPTAERVSVIRQHMARLDWNAETRARLARQWGLSDHRVGELAAEASRSLRADPAEVSELRAQLAATCEEIVRIALEETSDTTGLRDLRSALDAIELAARFRGAAPPEAAQNVNLLAEGEDPAGEPHHAGVVRQLLLLERDLAAGDLTLARQHVTEAFDLVDPFRAYRLGANGEPTTMASDANGISMPALPAHQYDGDEDEATS